MSVLDEASLKDKKRVEEFTGAILTKIAKGRKEHGETFIKNPVDEAMNECLDLGAYSMVMYFRLKKIKESGIIPGND